MFCALHKFQHEMKFMEVVAEKTKPAPQNIFKTSILEHQFFFATTSTNAFHVDILQAYKKFVKFYHNLFEFKVFHYFFYFSAH